MKDLQLQDDLLLVKMSLLLQHECLKAFFLLMVYDFLMLQAFFFQQAKVKVKIA